MSENIIKEKVRPGIHRICSPDGTQKMKGGKKVWEINYTDASNKAKRKRVCASGIREAEEELVKARRKEDTKTCTWQQGLARFLAIKEAENLTRQYLSEATRLVNEFIAFDGQNKDIEQTSVRDITAFLDYKGRKKGQGRSANYALSVLKSLAECLLQNSLIRNYRFDKVKPIRYNKKAIHPFRPDEIQKHVEVLPEYARPIFLFTLLTGCRIGAACNLEEEHIEEAILWLKEKGTAGKGKKNRAVLLNDNIKAIIRTAQDFKRKNNFKRSYLFVNSIGNPWNPATYGKTTRNCWEKAGFVYEDGKTHTRHELRHGIASELSKRNIDLNSTSKLLGHASSLTTERSYIKTREEENAQIAQSASKAVEDTFFPDGMDSLLRA